MPILDIFAEVEKLKVCLNNLSVEDLQQEIAADPELLLLDIREMQELVDLGTIPGSVHVPRGMLEFWVDPESPYYKSELNDTNEVILFCNGGWRSALAAVSLKAMGVENVAHMSGGFGQWQKEIGRVVQISASK